MNKSLRTHLNVRSLYESLFSCLIAAFLLASCQSYKKEEIPVIALLDGENACPPEDCNGIWGYREMLKALEKPRSKAAREYKEWLGYNFDPTEFDLDETRGLLAEIID